MSQQEMLGRANHIAERACDRLRERTQQELLMREFHAVEAQGFKPDAVERLISSEGVKSWWSKVATECEAELSEAWRESYHEYRAELNTQLGDLRAHYTQQLAYQAEDQGDQSDPMGVLLEVGGRGAAIGGAAGLGLAAYSALLGPASASISVLGAASAMVPPLTIAGAVGGIVAALISGQKREQQARENSIKLRNHVRDVQKKMIEEYLERTFGTLSVCGGGALGGFGVSFPDSVCHLALHTSPKVPLIRLTAGEITVLASHWEVMI